MILRQISRGTTERAREGQINLCSEIRQWDKI
jgi:hypothetical protein